MEHLLELPWERLRPLRNVNYLFCSLFGSEHEFDPDSYKIPFVILSLKTFAPQVHSLLQTHEGTVPLLR